MIKTKEQTLLRKVTTASVLVALGLVALKFGAWLITGSVVLLSSMIDSLLDTVTSTTNFLALRYAQKPADKNHRFGHQKIIDLASLVQATFIMGSAIIILLEAANRIQNPNFVHNPKLGVIVMVVSTLATLGLVLFQNQVIKKTNSILVKVDQLHYMTDFLLNLVVLASLGLSIFYQTIWFDLAGALFVAIFIFGTATKIAKKAMDALMDHEVDPQTRKKIKTLIQNHPQVIKISSLRTRVAGEKIFIQCDVGLDKNLNLKEAHEIAHAIEAIIKKQWPKADVVVHQEPA